MSHKVNRPRRLERFRSYSILRSKYITNNHI